MSSIINFIQNQIRKFNLNYIVIQNSNFVTIEITGRRSNLVNFYNYIKNKLPFPIRIILCKHNLRIEIPKWYLSSCNKTKIHSFPMSKSLANSTTLIRTIPKFNSIVLLISKFIVDYDLDNETEYFKIDLKGFMSHINNNTIYNINVKEIIYYLRELSNLEKVRKVRYRYNRRYLEVLFIS